jgi:hypothetical protein
MELLLALFVNLQFSPPFLLSTTVTPVWLETKDSLHEEISQRGVNFFLGLI